MASITQKMGLTKWDLGTDQYNHSQLASNFDLIDGHDHTPGKGSQIPTAGLVDASVTSAKLASFAVSPPQHIPNDSITGTQIGPGAIGASEIADGSIGAAEIAAGAISLSKLDPNVLPAGMVMPWYRPNSSISIPTGWEVCDGRSWSSIPNVWGVVTGTIPDLRNRFILGASNTGTGIFPTDPPDIGATGGSHTRDLSHAHTMNAHSHNVSSHTHGIFVDGDHKHQFQGEHVDSNGVPVGGIVFNDLKQRGTAVAMSKGIRQALFVPGLNPNQYYGEEVNAPMQTTGAHNHTGITAAQTATTDAQISSMQTSLSSSADLRPQFVGLLYLMKVL